MNKTILVTATILGILGITLGAFAAHGLKKLINEDALTSFQTGVRYQLYHAFLLLIIGSTNFLGSTAKKQVFYLIILGLICFSGSIYGLSTNVLSSFDFKQIALITPVGGLLLIIGWLRMLIGIIKSNTD